MKRATQCNSNYYDSSISAQHQQQKPSIKKMSRKRNTWDTHTHTLIHIMCKRTKRTSDCKNSIYDSIRTAESESWMHMKQTPLTKPTEKMKQIDTERMIIVVQNAVTTLALRHCFEYAFKLKTENVHALRISCDFCSPLLSWICRQLC